MIIFDLDGTLWDTVEATYKAVNTITSKYDDIKPITLDTVKNGMGLSSAENSKNYMPYLDESKALDYLKEISKTTSKIINDVGANIYDGVENTIINLAKNYKLGIITNNNDEYVKAFFKVSKLDNYFIDYIGTASYGITKSDAIKEMVNRNHAVNSFYVGDIEKDMIAALNAKVGFIHAKYGFGKNLKSKYSIENINELPDLMNSINRV